MPLIPLGDLLFPEGKWRCNGSEGEGRSELGGVEMVICGWDVLCAQINEKEKKSYTTAARTKIIDFSKVSSLDSVGTSRTWTVFVRCTALSTIPVLPSVI